MEGRLIPLDLFDGPQNMSIDQAILEEASNRQALSTKPTLRFYGWSAPTLSLGYFQGLAERSGHVASQSLAVVRRSTGGGAIVHDRELTYSMVVPLECQSQLLGRSSPIGAVPEFYSTVHLAIIDSLRDFGCRAEIHGVALPDSLFARPAKERQSQPFLCFQRRTQWDVVVGAYKIVGSAQRRVRGSVLQHGSVLMASSPGAPELPGASDLVSSGLTAEVLSRAVTQRLGVRLGVQWQVGDLAPAEQMMASEIRRQRFCDPSWLARH